MSQTALASSNVRRISPLDLPGGGPVIVDGNYTCVGLMTPPYGTSIIDVEVDDRGLIYLLDRNVGLDILEFDR